MAYQVDDDTILDLYDAGWSMAYIGRLLNVSKHNIRKCLRHHNKKLRRWTDYDGSRLSHDEMYTTMILYRDGEMSIREVARELGLASSTVLYRLDRMGVPRRSKSEGLSKAFAKGARTAGKN